MTVLAAMTRIRIFAAFALCLPVLPGFAGDNTFTLTGPEGAYVPVIAVQPGHPDVVLALTNRGVYRSTNAGLNWTLGSPQYGEALAFDPSNPDRAYLLSQQVYVSNDGGVSFTLSPGSPTDLTEIAVSGSRLYVASYKGTVYRTDDAGQNWTSLTVPWSASAAGTINSIVADPSSDGVLYVCVLNQGTYKTTDRGATWIPPAPGSPCSGQSNYAWSYAVSPADPNRVLAATGDGLFLSTNGGAGWSNINSLSSIEWLYFDPAAPSHVIGVGQIGPIQQSTDGGLTWPTFIPWPTLLHSRMTGAAFAGAAGRLYVATYSGPIYSSDGGSSFALRVGGMHAGRVTDIVAADDGTIYAMQYSGPSGLWRRVAGGWVALDNDELRTRANNELRLDSLATAAQDSSLVYVVEANQVFRSNNRGVDWNAPPATVNGVRAVTVDPTNLRSAYLSTSGGVMHSTDGGATFSVCGATAPPFDRLRVDRSAPDVLFGLGSYPPYRHLYKSVNGCASWNDISGEASNSLIDFTIDPADHDRIFLVSLDSVRRTRDGGATWTPVNFGDPFGETFYANRLLIDPVHTSTLWAPALSTPGFARSVDDGRTWQHVKAPFSGGFYGLSSGVLDPLSPDTLVAGADVWGLVEYQVAPDLEVSLDVPASPWPAGSVTTASVHVHNLGPLDASPPEITLSMPASMKVSAVPANCTVNAAVIRCELAAVHVGETASVPLGLIPAASASPVNLTAAVTGHEKDPVAGNNSVTQSISSTLQVDLRLALTTTATTVDHGAVVRFTATATNQGASPAASVALAFNLGSFTAPVLGSTCAAASLVSDCVFGTLASGESVTVTLDVKASGLGANTLTATVQDGTAQFSAAQSQTVTARPVGDVSVDVTDSADPVQRDTNYQYTATVRNVSGDPAPVDFAATVTGATVASATTSGGNCTTTTSTVACSLTGPAPGASTTITINTSSATVGTASISAGVTYAGTDSVAGNNSASASTTISAPPAPTPPGGGGKGGGGRFDWLAAGLLGALLSRRSWSARSARSTQR